MITIKHDFASPIISGRRVHIDYEEGVKLEGGTRSEATFHCRVVGGPSRLYACMLTDRSGKPALSREGFVWAVKRALGYARLLGDREPHSSDADCEASGTIDPETSLCGCGGSGGDPCQFCGRERYHSEDCPDPT